MSQESDLQALREKDLEIKILQSVANAEYDRLNAEIEKLQKLMKTERKTLESEESEATQNAKAEACSCKAELDALRKAVEKERMKRDTELKSVVGAIVCARDSLAAG